VDRSVIATLIVAAVLVAALLLMLRSWSRRKRAQSEIAVPPAVPAEFVEVARTETLYLATTPDGLPFERIAVRGLGFRARFDVVVAESGIILPIPGETPVFIPAGAIREISTASWTIDRGIEPNGLTVVRWTLGDTQLDSYFRFEEPAIFTSAAQRLTAPTGSDK
jgi:hypothetical protein